MMFDGLADARGYIFIPDEPPASVEALNARYEKLVAGCSPDGTELWRNWVIRDRESDTLVGYTQATIRDRLAFIAYQVFPAHGYRASRPLRFEQRSTNCSEKTRSTRSARWSTHGTLRRSGFSKSWAFFAQGRYLTPTTTRGAPATNTSSFCIELSGRLQRPRHSEFPDDLEVRDRARSLNRGS